MSPEMERDRNSNAHTLYSSTSDCESGDGDLPLEQEKLVENCKKSLSEDQQIALRSLLYDFRDGFALSGEPLDKTTWEKHRIDVGQHKPIKKHPRCTK